MNKYVATALISFAAGALIAEHYHQEKHKMDATMIKNQTTLLSSAKVFMEEAEKTMTPDQKRKFQLEYNVRVRFLDLVDKY